MMTSDNGMKIRPGRPRNRERGAALLLVVFAVLFLGLVVTGLYEVSRFSWEDNSRERGLFQAKLLAESGAAIASHPGIKPGDPALRQEWPGGRKFQARITSEGGRILVSTLDDGHFIETLTRLFILWGLDATSASIAADSLADWVDEDGEARPNGAESEYYSALGYPGFPANEAFTSLEQMLLVRGMDRVARQQPRWREYFTLYGDGRIDPNAAPADLLEAFFGATPDAALNLAATRAGADLTEGTDDDYTIESASEAQALLGLANEQWQQVQDWVTLQSNLRRVESVGSTGDEFFYRLVVLTEVNSGDGGAGTAVARFSP